MKSIKVRVLWGAFVALSVIGGVSCSNDIGSDSRDDEDTYNKIEGLALDSYMADIPEAERQSAGYYVVADDLSSRDGVPSDKGVWVRYNINSYSLDGNLCNTRTESLAKLMGTFTYKTRYTPILSAYINLNGEDTEEDTDTETDSEENEEIEEAALAQALKYGVVVNGEQRPLYAGNKFTIYSPSRLNGRSYNGVGGYGGQYTLSSGRPMKSDIEIVEIIDNVAVEEQRDVDHFMSINPSGWKPVSSQEVDKGVYINQDFTHDMLYNYVDEYVYGRLCKYYDEDNNIYQAFSFDELESLIVKFLEEEEFVEADDVDDDIYDSDETDAKIYYILRTLDGFILDSNIGFVNSLVFGTGGGNSPISYSDDVMSNYIDAWAYAIPDLQYGKWASILTTSTYAYGTSGKDMNSSSATEIQPYTPLLFNIYIADNE